MPLKLYADPGSQPSQAVHYVLKKLEIDFEYVTTLAGEGTKTEEYIKINPLKKVPAIVHDDFILIESVAIISYLCDSFEKGETLLPRDDQKQRARVNMWLQWNGGELRHNSEKMWYVCLLNHNWLGIPEASDEVKQKSKEVFFDSLEHLENQLAKTEYVSGDSISAADVQIFFEIYITMLAIKLDLSKFASINKWIQKVMEDPIIKELTEQSIKSLLERLPE